MGLFFAWPAYEEEKKRRSHLPRKEGRRLDRPQSAAAQRRSAVSERIMGARKSQEAKVFLALVRRPSVRQASQMRMDRKRAGSQENHPPAITGLGPELTGTGTGNPEPGSSKQGACMAELSQSQVKFKAEEKRGTDKVKLMERIKNLQFLPLFWEGRGRVRERGTGRGGSAGGDGRGGGADFFLSRVCWRRCCCRWLALARLLALGLVLALGPRELLCGTLRQSCTAVSRLPIERASGRHRTQPGSQGPGQGASEGRAEQRGGRPQGTERGSEGREREREQRTRRGLSFALHCCCFCCRELLLLLAGGAAREVVGRSVGGSTELPLVVVGGRGCMI